MGDNTEEVRGASGDETAGTPDHEAEGTRDMAKPQSIKSPAFQFYPKDFLSSSKVQRMSLTEVGIYILLLSRAWLDGSLPSDVAEIAKLVKVPTARFAKMWRGSLSECFIERAGRLVNARMEDERKKQADFRRRQSDNGKVKWQHVEVTGTHSRPRHERMAIARAKGRHTNDEWREMVEFFESRCVHCGSGELPVERDHVIPIYQGGDDSIRNLQPSCARCNAAKGPDRTDHRPNAAAMLGKSMPPAWVPDACQMPALQSASASASATAVKKEISDAPLRDASPAVLTFPTIGKGPTEWTLTEHMVSEWLGAYPGVDVRGECGRALAWIRANGPKTAKGMPAFLVRWLNTSVNRGSRPLAFAATGTEGRGRTGAPPKGKYDGIEEHD